MTPCGLCGAPDFARASALVRQVDATRSYRRCCTCGSIVLVPLPVVEANEHFEGDRAAGHRERSDNARAGYFARRLDLVERHAGGRGRLLDVGCSTGLLLEQARARGWQVEGVELSRALADAARRRNPGVTIHESDFLAWGDEARARYDAVVAIDVFEHVLAPGDFVGRAAALLRPGGVVLVQTPNAGSLRARLHGGRWNMLLPEYHFHLPSARALAGLLRHEGLAVRVITTTSGSGSERGLAGALARAKEALLAPARLGNALLVVATRHAS
jgi:2-polyprenyl-3-methyl-5-hydroxy-6-metoxy-1,4-benzoquinol methylase